MATAYLSLGSNLGDRSENLTTAIEEIGKRIGSVTLISQRYETGAWGFESDAFLNQAIAVDTTLDPHKMMGICLSIEKEMGRERKPASTGYAARLIDIDILFYGNLILNSDDLTIPHPLIPDRKFVLVPLNDIAPELIHPIRKQTVADLLKVCPDTGMIHAV